jgi:hypothetical protein
MESYTYYMYIIIVYILNDKFIFLDPAPKFICLINAIKCSLLSLKAHSS